jgi:hypothetical protein
LLFDAAREDSLKISLQEERLQVFCEKIRQLQHEIVINEKVIMLVAIVMIYSSTGDEGI